MSVRARWLVLVVAMIVGGCNPGDGETPSAARQTVPSPAQVTGASRSVGELPTATHPPPSAEISPGSKVGGEVGFRVGAALMRALETTVDVGLDTRPVPVVAAAGVELIIPEWGIGMTPPVDLRKRRAVGWRFQSYEGDEVAIATVALPESSLDAELLLADAPGFAELWAQRRGLDSVEIERRPLRGAPSAVVVSESSTRATFLIPNGRRWLVVEVVAEEPERWLQTVTFHPALVEGSARLRSAIAVSPGDAGWTRLPESSARAALSWARHRGRGLEFLRVSLSDGAPGLAEPRFRSWLETSERAESISTGRVAGARAVRYSTPSRLDGATWAWRVDLEPTGQLVVRAATSEPADAIGAFEFEPDALRR